MAANDTEELNESSGGTPDAPTTTGAGPFAPNSPTTYVDETGTSTTASSQTAETPAYAPLSTAQAYYDNSAAASIGLISEPPAQGTNELKLDEYSVTAGINGQRVQISVCHIGGGHFLDKSAAVDFIYMRALAKEAGIALYVNHSFRSWEKQDEIYRARYNPDGTQNARGKKEGVAAKPGYSKHQAGKSVDISVRMAYGANGSPTPPTPEYLWLVQNASLFGFENDVKSEPWHWTHKSDEVIFAPEKAGISLDLSILNTAATVFSALLRPGERALAVAVHDVAAGLLRGTALTQTSRDAYFDEAAAFSIKRSADISGLKSRVSATAATLLQSTVMKQGSSDHLFFDFGNGRWARGTDDD